MSISQKIKKKIKEKLPILIICTLIFLFVFVFLFNQIVIIIESGEGGVLYRLFFDGTVTNKVYDEGIHFVWPWDKMYVYNVRFQQVPHQFNVLTNNGLKVDLFISIRYRPEYKLVGKLHKEVGPNYVNIVVIPEIENVLRVLIGKMDAEQVYKTERAIIEKSISDAAEQIAQRFVKVDDVIIKRMQLPPQIEKTIQDKMDEKHRADAYRFRIEKEKQELERKRIEAEGLKIFNESLSKEILHWMGIQATLNLSESANAKTVVIGSGKSGLPIIGNIPFEVTENEQTQRPAPDNMKTSEPAPPESQPEPAKAAEQQTDVQDNGREM